MLEYRIDQQFEVRYDYPVCFTRDAFAPGNPVLADLLRPPSGGRARLLVAVDDGVANALPGLCDAIEAYAETHAETVELACPPWAVRGGEAAKNAGADVDAFYRRVVRFGVCRHSYVAVIGGGAVLDAIGYAAATAHRGIRLVRMPSTVLGQNDAGVGVKNAVNWMGRKNFLGTFVPPFAVVNDFALLASGPAADRRAGIAEAVKVALIRDAAFFARLLRERHALADLQPHALEPMIVRCAELHLAQIRCGGDPFERGSARPLDFGHWSAHSLEELSGHRLRHGEAVAIGIALDTLYSRRVGLLGAADAQQVLALLADLGFVLSDPALARLDIAGALAAFREHLGGALCITLLAGIGRGVEVDTIDTQAMADCVRMLADWHPRRAGVAPVPAGALS
ncbi:3-dehydroquinate synthase [Pseudoduganella flava]|uniref:3-dehydroquinate synthase n=1 Tax=Pseudoduganella flava TaxID=871742 RepID=A0A562PQF4_9BURK|nr:3-dehydroquinate synthase [Pseudoduganella flava]QGZ37848.1 3-dehydroquinate synthase [Pseudoduganella flava]TWI46677.1 3-dehydroquinate synthase [Pseudoduganella flava]